MAQRTKTIEYCFPLSSTSLASTTRRDLAAITLFIPETTSRTFRSVHVEVDVIDNQITASNLTAWTIGVKLGAAAFEDTTTTTTLNASGEHRSFHFIKDATSYFSTNFGAGASQTCQVGFQFDGNVTINISVKLVITYEYDDAATTRIKTVKIPFDGETSVLGTVLGEVGTNQIPNLDSFLPEASKVYRDIFFEVQASENVEATTDMQMGLALDAEGEVLDGLHETALNSNRFYMRRWKRTDMTTSATHAFMARSTVADRFLFLNVVLVVTYEYDHSTSTSIMNSIGIPFMINGGIAGTDVIDLDKSTERSFFVEEPATVALVQSGIILGFTDGSVISNLQIRIGSQAFRSYSHQADGSTVGMFTLGQRIDSGGAQGAGMTLARGLNTFLVAAQDTEADQNEIGGNCSGIAYINYTSGKHADGDGVHNHTTQWNLGTTGIEMRVRDTEIAQAVIPESSYYVNDVSFFLSHQSGQSVRDSTVQILAQLLAGEGKAEGWRSIRGDTSRYDNESVNYWFYAADTEKDWKRHPGDPDAFRMDPTAARRMRSVAARDYTMSYRMFVTWHAIAVSVAGCIVGFAGDGSGIAVEIHRTDTDEKVQDATSIIGGDYTADWYDDTITMYAHARQDDTHVGRSNDGLAS